MKHRNNSGNIMMVILLVVLLTFLGLGLMSFSTLHNWIRGSRTHKLSAVAKMRSELTYYLHHFYLEVFGADIRDFGRPETDFFNADHFPDTTGVIDHRIKIRNSFSHRTVPKNGYDDIRVTDVIDVVSPVHPYGIRAEVSIDMVCGQIPLTFFPFFLNTAGDIPGESFIEGNHPVNGGDGNMVIGGVEVERDTGGFLMDCLGIQGDELTWALIRMKFGFELSDQPLPNGVHLLEEGGAVRCIFIQGDVERLAFFAEGDIQKIRFVRGGMSYEYHYKPGEDYFMHWNDRRLEDKGFDEKILVNGNIGSLEQVGDAAFTASSNITLFASGTIVIRTNLLAALDSKVTLSTHLTLLSCFEKLFGGEGKTPGIVVETVHIEDGAEIQVSIVTDGKVVNKNPKLKVEGGIYCEELENQGVIEVNHLKSNSGCGAFFRTLDFKTIYHFHIRSMEEV